MQRMTLACLLVSACALSSSATAQETADAGTVPGRLSRTISWTESRLGGGTDGPYPEFGGLITGAGISAGPGYRTRLFGIRALVDVSASRSWHGYSMLQSKIEWPRLLDDRLSLGSQIKYADFTQINFFGIGNETLKSDFTDFRLKYLDAGGFAALRPSPSVTITGRAGVMRHVAIGSGTSTLHRSIESRFTDDTAPGLILQPNYLHADVAVEADTRNVPGYPSSGGRYRVSLAAFQDRDFGRYSFRRIEAEASQYVPLSDRFVLAARGRMDVSQTSAGQQVPFYLLPALGSGQSLRGYEDYRFRDRDLVLASAECRWHAARAMDAAVFYDAGAVAPTVAQTMSGRRLRTDYGVGVRLHTKRYQLARLDVARSREGLQTIVSFTPPLSLSKRTVAPYVP